MNLLMKKLRFHLPVLFKKTHFRVHVKRKFRSWNIMFFGNDQFSVINLEGLFKCLEKKTIMKLEVVSFNEKTPVAEYAVSKNLKLHLWPPHLCDAFDIGVVVSFGKLIPKTIIEFFPLGVINVHASLLPQYRGANPIFHAIKNGDTVTGITVMKIKPLKFDIGDIVLQEKYPIGSHDLLPNVTDALARLGASCLVKTINDLPHSLKNSVPQSSHLATSAPKIKKDVSIVNWGKATATEIYNLYRAVFGKYKLTTTWNSKKMKLLCISTNFVGKSKKFERVNVLPPGSLEYCEQIQVLRVHCLDKPLYICTLQMEHKVLVAYEFHRCCLNRVSKDKWVFH